jgi:L,D-peptidoglycan transpeptidase YkuD (ErfK/YbiS/YcfS/YnhG family)
VVRLASAAQNPWCGWLQPHGWSMVRANISCPRSFVPKEILKAFDAVRTYHPRMRRRHILTLAPSLLASCGTPRVMPPVIPRSLAASVPQSCRQVVCVVSPRRSSITARAWQMERRDRGSVWPPLGDPFPVTLGRHGLAWGLGPHTPPPPAGWSIKREGDGCSPAGVFPITFAFGSAAKSEEPSIRLPYRQCTPTLRGVDDPASRYYNQVVDATTVVPDWGTSEDMLRDDGLYRWGAFVAHNPDGRPAAGSCIFLHLWRGPHSPTAGCTAMDEDNLRRLLAWFDPAATPCLVQITDG